MHPFVYPDIAVMAPSIYLPKKDIPLDRWAVIACDQFTSQRSYWTTVKHHVTGYASTYHIVLPEVYLESDDADTIHTRIRNINIMMSRYLEEGILRRLPPGFILLDRQTPFHRSRKGLMLAIDLEQYDFSPGTKKPIRATEGTVLSRIPPRVEIRKHAPMDVPHIMLLIDDAKKTVIEPAFDALSKTNDALYQTDLMQGGGHIDGYFCEAESPIARQLVDRLQDLIDNSPDRFLFAVGDGNHSLATAKAHWDEIKDLQSGDLALSHPARYALVEVVNLHDDGLDFEPIHRVLFDVTFDAFKATATRFFSDQAPSFLPSPLATDTSDHIVEIVAGEKSFYLCLKKPLHTLSVGSLQSLLDSMLKNDSSCRVDYIHGRDAVIELSKEGHLGFILPPISKHDLFITVRREGVFPKKTFSMGKAVEKRYYMEIKSLIVEE